MKHKRIVSLNAWLMCFILSACASLPAPPSESVREEWGRMVIAPARFAPQSNIRSFAVGTRKGIAKGAATGAAGGLAFTQAFAAGGALEAVIAPYLMIVALPVMATTGALAGKGAAISEQDAAALDAHIQRNLAGLNITDTLALEIARTAQQDSGRQLPIVDTGPMKPTVNADYSVLSQQRVNAVLEVTVNEVGFTGGKQMQFYMVARVRVIRVPDNQPVYKREFVYQSDEYGTALWGRSHAALFQAELQRAYASLAESVVEETLLLTQLPLTSKSRLEEGHAGFIGYRDTCGLAWVSPIRDYHPAIRDISHRKWNRFPIVDSLEPTLAWEAFPREADRQANKTINLADIHHVRYDLRVWQVSDDLPPGLVYEKRDLIETSHTIQQALQAKSRYFWSVRARFELHGRVHSIRWSYYRTPYYLLHGNEKVKPETSPGSIIGVFLAGAAPRDPCTLDFIPTTNYYRFQTP